MRMPMNGGSVPVLRCPRATSCARPAGVAVLLGVGPVAVAVLEVDAEVLDRLALELRADARVDLGRDSAGGVPSGASSPIAAAKAPRVGRVLGEGPQRELAELRARCRP